MSESSKVKVILFMAMSVNGYIAAPDGNEDFLSHSNWLTFLDLIKIHKAFIYGRHTYELVTQWDTSYFKPEFDQAFKIVVSSKPHFNLKSGFHQARSSKEALTLLSKHNLSSVILAGGSFNNTSFVQQQLIDEVIINLEPVILGEGVNLFKPAPFNLKLKYLDHLVFPSGIIKLHYQVEK